MPDDIPISEEAREAVEAAHTRYKGAFEVTKKVRNEAVLEIAEECDRRLHKHYERAEPPSVSRSATILRIMGDNRRRLSDVVASFDDGVTEAIVQLVADIRTASSEYDENVTLELLGEAVPLVQEDSDDGEFDALIFDTLRSIIHHVIIGEGEVTRKRLGTVLLDIIE